MHGNNVRAYFFLVCRVLYERGRYAQTRVLRTRRYEGREHVPNKRTRYENKTGTELCLGRCSSVLSRRDLPRSHDPVVSGRDKHLLDASLLLRTAVVIAYAPGNVVDFVRAVGFSGF